MRQRPYINVEFDKICTSHDYKTIACIVSTFRLDLENYYKGLQTACKHNRLDIIKITSRQ